MSARRASTRVLSMLLVLFMVVGMMPMNVFAAETDDTLAASLEETKTFIDGLTVNSSSNDPEKVVTTVGTHFSWDNEKRENSKKYLYEWSYYNGVVFEGLDYVYDVTGETAYYSYVKEYLDAMITGGALNSYAGYVDYHGADCYKTASLLLDYYKLTGDEKYLSVAETLYADLDAAAESYLLSDAGYNYHHTWASASSPALWLDGLYMILPFRAEYAAHIGDTEELDLIVDRLQWVSDNMYNEDEGLFYHAANNASSNSGTYWLRSIGWYAAAIVDVMDSMSGDNRTALQTQLKKLVDGMIAKTSADNGNMWLNNMAGSYNASTNPYETSGTALVYYAVMKAVNNGWLDASYADYALDSFVYMCENKLENNVLTDICFKGAPGSSNSTFYDNEGKGVGPFIMLYAEVLEYVNEQEEEVPETTEPEVTEPEVTEPELRALTVSGTTAYAVGDELTFTAITAVYSDGSTAPVDVKDCAISGTYDMNTAGSYSVTLTYNGVTSAAYWFTVDEPSTFTNNGISVSGVIAIGELGLTNNTEANAEVAAALGVENYISYDITPAGTDVEGEGNVVLRPGNYATVSVKVDPAWENVKCWYIPEEGEPEQVEGTLKDGVFTFRTNHFSTWLLGTNAVAEGDTGADGNSVSGEGNLTSDPTYVLDTDGVDAGAQYLIVSASSGSAYALRNNNGSVARQSVSIANGKITTVENADDCLWTISAATNGNISNGETFIRLNSGILGESRAMTTTHWGNGAYTIYGNSRYLRYSGSSWGRSSSNVQYDEDYNVYLFKYTPGGSGEAVTFTVTPASATILPNGTTTLTGTVVVGSTTYNLSELDEGDIEWDTSNSAAATVEDGTVTGVADGTTATITATLKSVKGAALEEEIPLNVAITVQSKAITSAVLSGNSQINVTLNETPDYSNIKYTVTYEDDSTNVYTAENGLTFGTCDTTTSGKKVVDIMFNGTKVGEVTVNVTVDFSKLDPATDYPEYPNDGAVRIDKTATHDPDAFRNTGVTHVELDVAGISVRQGVDVVLVVDISNSMGWSLENAGNSADADRVADEGQTNKLEIAMNSASDFADILLADNNGSATDNTLSFVTFAGYDATFGKDGNDSNVVDSLLEVFRKVDDADAAKVSFAGTEMTYTTTYQIKVTDEEGNVLVNGNNRGDTNYDYAFWQALQTVNAIKADNAANGQGTREVYIVFMTDGAPSHYNHNNKSGASGRRDQWPNQEGYYNVANDYTGSKNDWYGYFSGSANTYAKTLYDAVNGNFYAIGFDLAHGGYSVSGTTWQWTQEELVAVLEQVAYHGDETRKVEVSATADATELEKIYAELATKLRYAGTEAVVTDTVGNNFSVQMAPYVVDKDGNQIALATAPTITIKAYDLYAKGSTDEAGNDITGERVTDEDGNYVFTAIETVTFNENGTEAYSEVNGVKSGNILTKDADGNITINAQYFTYTKNAATSEETFVWNIGNITDKEIALTFDAYLEGSMSGERPENVYYTNEEAILEYVDINGDYGSKTFPVPGVAWGGASTTIRFYLVNEEGEPVNHAGDVVPWANRVYVGDSVTVALNLNADLTLPAQTIEAAAHVPGTYFLYDQNASYTVQTASGDNNPIVGGITPSTPSEDAYKTTYDENGNAIKQTGEQTTRVIDHEATYYTWSIVGFGVRYDLTKEKITPLNEDKVVIDYGKAIQVDVLANETDAVDTSLYTMELVGFVKYDASTDINYIMANQGSATYTADNGQFSIVDRKVNFQPSRMISELQRVFAVIKVTEIADTTNYHYRYNTLTIIPATIMYYETDFATGVFDVENVNNPDLEDDEHPLVAWSSTAPDASYDNLQNYVKIGKDLYGYDRSYEDDGQLSNGSSMFVKGQGTDYTTAEFSFTGTGFDLISRTGTAQGAIRVDVYSDEARTTRVKSVTVLNKSESQWELYQIPVASIELGTHGTYYVTVRVAQAYTNDNYPVLTRGAEFYFDAIRVYEPIIASASAEAGSDAAIAYAAYEADGELNPQIVEVRNVLLTAEDFNAAGATASEGIVFGEVVVDRPTTEGGTEQSNVTVSTYQTIGPNNEVYLSNGQAISFNVKTGAIAPATFNLGVKSVNGETVNLQATIFKDGTEVQTVTNTAISSSTVQFFTLFEEGKAEANTVYQVVITNTGSGILSLTDLKFAGSTEASDVQIDSDENSVEAMKYVLVYGTPKAEEEETPDFGVVSAEFSESSAKRGDTVTMVITTSADVVSVAVTNVNGAKMNTTVESVVEENGQKVWTVTFALTSAGTQKFTAVGYNAGGEAGTTVETAIKVNIR